MALTPLATPADGSTTLTAALWNNEFRNIYNNALTLVSPLTGNLNVGSNQLTNVRVENVTATPSGASAGRLTFHTTSKELQIDDGAQIRMVPAFYTITQGDIIYATSSGQYGRLPIGSAFQVLQATGSIPAWTGYVTAAGINNTGSLVVGGGSSITKVITATGSCVWPAMNSAATISTTISVAGASVTNTDQVLVSHSSVTVASVVMHGYVTSAGVVTVTLYNGTGATYNAGSGTLRATVFQYV